MSDDEPPTPSQQEARDAIVCPRTLLPRNDEETIHFSQLDVPVQPYQPPETGQTHHQTDHTSQSWHESLYQDPAALHEPLQVRAPAFHQQDVAVEPLPQPTTQLITQRPIPPRVTMTPVFRSPTQQRLFERLRDTPPSSRSPGAQHIFSRLQPMLPPPENGITSPPGRPVTQFYTVRQTYILPTDLCHSRALYFSVCFVSPTTS